MIDLALHIADVVFCVFVIGWLLLVTYYAVRQTQREYAEDRRQRS